jgi:hypothetical protein
MGKPVQGARPLSIDDDAAQVTSYRLGADRKAVLLSEVEGVVKKTFRRH